MKGEYECGNVQNKSISLDTVKRMTEDHFGLNINFNEAIELIKTKGEFGLVLEEDDQIYSKYPKKSVKCLAKQIYKNNSKTLLISLIVMTIIGFLVSQIQ